MCSMVDSDLDSRRLADVVGGVIAQVGGQYLHVRDVRTFGEAERPGCHATGGHGHHCRPVDGGPRYNFMCKIRAAV
jgi:hypothetical protein